jgi:hypothetical protein
LPQQYGLLKWIIVKYFACHQSKTQEINQNFTTNTHINKPKLNVKTVPGVGGKSWNFEVLPEIFFGLKLEMEVESICGWIIGILLEPWMRDLGLELFMTPIANWKPNWILFWRMVFGVGG